MKVGSNAVIFSHWRLVTQTYSLIYNFETKDFSHYSGSLQNIDGWYKQLS